MNKAAGFKLVYPNIPVVTKFPEEHRRFILQYVGGSREEVNEVLSLCRCLDIPYTYEPCNLEYRGMRLLVSSWHDAFEIFKLPPFFEAFNEEPLDGRKMFTTPIEGSAPLRVIKYMKEGAKHFSRTELFMHETLSFEVGRLLRSESKFLDYFTSASASTVGEYLVDRDSRGSVKYITGTFKFWFKFLTSYYVPVNTQMYREVKESFLRFFSCTEAIKEGEYEVD